MADMEFKKEEQQYVKLPYFGIPKLLPYLRPLRGIIFGMVGLCLIAGVIDAITPQFQKYALNHFIGQNTLDTLLPFILIYLGILLVQTAGNLISAFMGGKIEMYVSRDMRRASFNHLQTLSFSYYNQNSVGYIHSRVMSDTGRIGGLVSWSLMDGVWNLTYMVGSIAAMFMMNWKLCLLVLVIVPLASLASIYFQRHLVRLNRRVREINSQITSGFNEGITGAKTTKTLVAEQRM